MNLFLASLLLWVLWQYGVRAKLVREDVADSDLRFVTRRVTPGLGFYVALIVLGLFRPTAAVIGYLVIAFFLMFPFAGGGRPGDREGRQPGR